MKVYLTNPYEKENNPFISHHNINIRSHLSSFCLRLNGKGVTRLGQNYKKFYTNIDLDNVDTFSDEPNFNSTPNITISQACNQFKRQTEDCHFSKVRKYDLE